jgi:hypothetical protein
LGDTFWLPQRPDIVLTNKALGQVVAPQLPSSNPIQLQVNRLTGYDFLVYDATKTQSDIDVGMEGTTDVALALDGKLQGNMYATLALGKTAGAAYIAAQDAAQLSGGTFTDPLAALASIAPLCDASNTGNTAGLQYNGYNLGSPTTPLSLTPSTAILFFTALASVIAEANKISLAALKDLWVVVPECARYVLMNSDIRKAMEMGDSTSVIRTGHVGKLVDTSIYRSPLLYSPPLALTSNKVVFAVPFGNKAAINFAMQMKSAEKIRFHDAMADRYRGEVLWDFNVVKSSALGIAWITVANA